MEKALKILVTIGIIGLIVGLILHLKPTPVSAAWYDSGWSYRVKVTVQSSKVDANLTDFPVYVDLSNLPSEFHTNVNSDGGDIRITTSNGTTEVAREVVTYDSSGDSGELHFKASGTLSSSTDTDFYIYYGNSSASDYAIDATYGAETVWSDYAVVIHLQEDPSSTSDGPCGGSTKEVCDSTSNDYDGDSNGTMTDTDSVDVKLGKGLAFDGSDDYIDLGDITQMDGVTKVTISAWTQRAASNQALPIGKRDGASDTMSMNIWTDGGTYWNVSDGTTAYGRSTESSTALDHRVMVYDGTQSTANDRVAAYINGSADTLAYTGTLPTATPNLANFYIDRDNSSETLGAGNIDEVRVSADAKTSTWVSTEYNNQNSPSTFYSVGSEEAGQINRVQGNVRIKGGVRFK